MDYDEFMIAGARIRALEDAGRFEEAEAAHRLLIEKDLDHNQYAIGLIGLAVCHLRANQPVSARDVLSDVELQGLDQTVQAVLRNLRAQVHHEMEQYLFAIQEAREAESIARGLGPQDKDVLGEALALQGFAEAELGSLCAGV